MQKPLKLPKPVTKGLTENQLKALHTNTDALATSSDDKIKASAWRSIKKILEYISS